MPEALERLWLACELPRGAPGDDTLIMVHGRYRARDGRECFILCPVRDEASEDLDEHLLALVDGRASDWFAEQEELSDDDS